MSGADSRWLKAVLLAAGAMLMQGCGTMGYYLQSAQGQIEVLAARRPIDAVIADETESNRRREQLRRLKAMRQFASAELGLPDNRSYTTFSDVRRPFVITNVFATPELSLTPVRSCFLIVGCLDYRGYFQPFRARRYADELRRQGYDVYVGGVAAYSTLGWFDDPVLNSMLAWDEPRLAKFLFHELAHQQLYVRDDTAFNEAFAEAVAEVGLARWLARHTEPPAARRYRDAEAREQAFVEEVLRTRIALATAYASPVSADEKRAMKTAAIADFRERYRRMKARWGGHAGYDGWVYDDLNNARISAVVTYHDRIPAFRGLLVLAGEDLQRFYSMAASIGRMPGVDRRRCLDALAAGPDHASAPCRIEAGK